MSSIPLAPPSRRLGKTRTVGRRRIIRNTHWPHRHIGDVCLLQDKQQTSTESTFQFLFHANTTWPWAFTIEMMEIPPEKKSDIPGIFCYFLYEPGVTSWTNVLLERGNAKAKSYWNCRKSLTWQPEWRSGNELQINSNKFTNYLALSVKGCWYFYLRTGLWTPQNTCKLPSNLNDQFYECNSRSKAGLPATPQDSNETNTPHRKGLFISLSYFKTRMGVRNRLKTKYLSLFYLVFDKSEWNILYK